MTIVITKDVRDRFWMKVDTSCGTRSCWLWVAGKDALGYGQFSYNGNRHTFAHRFSYLMHKGDPFGKCVLHKCDTPACVNPEHLFLGTRTDNAVDKVRKGRHPYGEAAAAAKLTDDDVREIRKRRSLGESQTSLARAFGVNQSIISRSSRGKTWQHVPLENSS